VKKEEIESFKVSAGEEFDGEWNRKIRNTISKILMAAGGIIIIILLIAMAEGSRVV
jgi:hypothetical protein